MTATIIMKVILVIIFLVVVGISVEELDALRTFTRTPALTLAWAEILNNWEILMIFFL